MPGLLTLGMRTSERDETLLLVTLPGALAVSITDQRPRGKRAGPTITQLRRHAEGAKIDEVAQSRRAARVSLIRGSAHRFLIVAPTKPYGAWWLCETDGSVVVRSAGAPALVPTEEAHLLPLCPDALGAQGQSALEAHRDGRRRQLERALIRQIKRTAKKRKAIEGDLARAVRAHELQEKASLLLAHAAEIPPGATFFEAPAWDAGEQPVRIEIDPGRRPTEEAQALFAKAKRLKRGLEIVPGRLDAVDEELAALEQMRANVSHGSPEELAAKLAAYGIEIEEPRERERKRRRAGARLPYREFVSQGNQSVLVGRGAADNDRLTLHVARPHDLWLHARGVTGAHVVVPLTKGKPCPAETLIDAATLAAHFSELRGEPVVDVLYTPRRFVRKRKGSAAGSVTLGREKVIAVRIERDRLSRLLEHEKRSR